MRRGLCIAIHDVAPATWTGCKILLAMLERIGRLPITLLVVPEYHRGERVDRSPEFVRGVNDVIATGGEVALHGYYHLDEAPPPRTLATWLQRRMLTDREGEFAALSLAEAEARIKCGRAMLANCGWDVAGFIPPAWLTSAGARAALRRSSLSYTSSHFALQRLADGARISAPCITASAQTAWRRLGSHAWFTAMTMATLNTALLRVALHPADARHPDLVNHWQRLIERLLTDRTALTKHQAVQQFGTTVRVNLDRSPSA